MQTDDSLTDADEHAASGSQEHTINRRALRSLLFRSLAAGASFFTVFVTARGFGADGRGIYALTSVSLSLMLSLLGGASHALAAEFAHARASMSRLYAAALLIAIVGGVIVVGIVFAVHLLVIDWHHVLQFAALALPAALVIDYVIWLLLTEGDVRRMHYIHFLQVALPLVALTLGAIVFHDRIYYALALWVCAFWILAATAIVNRWRHIGLDFHHTRELVTRVLRRGTRISVGNGITQLNYRLDLLVVAALLPIEDVGRYSVALAIGETLWLLSRSLMTGAYSAIMVAKTNDESVEITIRAFRHSLGLLTVASIVVGTAAALLIVPVFGEEFAGVWVPLVCVLPGIIAYGVCEVFREYFIVRLERVREYLVMGVTSAVANVTLAVLLIPPLGLAGAALSTSISYIAAGTYLLIRFSAITGSKRVRSYVPGPADIAAYRRVFRSKVA
jgi:O-antigen/teichoic acid export membrane protein